MHTSLCNRKPGAAAELCPRGPCPGQSSVPVDRAQDSLHSVLTMRRVNTVLFVQHSLVLRLDFEDSKHFLPLRIHIGITAEHSTPLNKLPGISF